MKLQSLIFQLTDPILFFFARDELLVHVATYLFSISHFFTSLSLSKLQRTCARFQITQQLTGDSDPSCNHALKHLAKLYIKKEDKRAEPQ